MIVNTVHHRAEYAKCACLDVKNIGKPCAGEPHARFDEGGQARACPLLYLIVFKTNNADPF